jgi:Pvc16 N-terminal domain
MPTELPSVGDGGRNMSVQGINDVTKALSQLVESQIRRSVSTATVTLLPPGDSLPEDVGVNLYLYRVVERPVTHSQPWRGDRAHEPSDRAPLGLQLHYLLTPRGRTSESSSTNGDVAHMMLGVAMVTLHQHPVLNDVHIQGFDADAVLSQHLRNSYEKVTVTISTVGIEELSKLWATINQPYRLSVAYEISLVELLPDQRPPAADGIVSRTDVEMLPLGRPLLASLSPPTGALARLVGGAVTANQLTISGSGLGAIGLDPVVLVGGRSVPLQASVQPPFTRLTASLPLNLDAGPQADVRAVLLGPPSDSLPLLVSPWLAGTRPVRTALDPAVPADVTLILTGQGLNAPFTVRFDGPGGPVSSPGMVTGELTGSAAVPTGLANGAYEVRVVLGDADNSLSNPRTLQVLPRVDAGPAVSVEADGQKHRLDLTGARLDGSEIRVVLDGVAYEAPANAAPAALSFLFNRLLETGRHTVAVVVDGQRSRVVTFTVPPG